MRPPAISQSARRHPLNAILGTEANVRLLRVLVDAHGEPVGPGELARRASLGRTSIYQSLDLLEQAGVVRFVGAGRQRQARFCSTHPLAPALEGLFAAEGKVFTALLDSLRRAAASVSEATAVWLEGPITTGADRLGEPLACSILGSAHRLPALTADLRQSFAAIESTYDVTIAIHGVTRSEIAMRGEGDIPALLDAILLAGTPPAAFHPGARRQVTRQRNIRSHGDHDARALATAERLADLIAHDPGVIPRALRAVERRLDGASPRERHELEEWAHILRTTTPRRLRDLLVHRDERMTRLRQTMPFARLLAPSDRARLVSRTSEDPGT